MEVHKKLNILKHIFGGYYKSGSEFLFRCPKCNHHKNKLSVNLDKDAFKCWVCDYSGASIYRLVRKYGSFLQKQEWEELDSGIDLSDPFYEVLFGEKQEHEQENLISLPGEFKTLTGRGKGISSVPAMNYLKRRGITKEDILRWKIGYCSSGEYSERIIIPSFNLDGMVDFFIARSYAGSYKYKNPKGASKDLIFNHLYVDWKNPVHIVEGVFDAITAGNAVPLLQCSLNENSKIFQEITKHDTPVYVALDPEAEKEAMMLIKKLIEYDVECYKVDVSGDKDLGDMTKEEYRTLVANAELMSPSSYLMNLTRG